MNEPEFSSVARIGPRERGDGVQRVEQEVRVDLSLQRAQLGAGRQLVLQLQLVDGELRGQKLGEARRQGVLRAVHVMRTVVVELEGTHRLVAHLERHDDARRDGAMGRALARHVDHVGERLGHAVLEHVARGGRVDRRPRREIGLELTHAGQHARVVGDGDRHGARLGQQALADLLRAALVQTLLDDLEHLGRRGQRLLGVERAQRIGVQA